MIETKTFLLTSLLCILAYIIAAIVIPRSPE